MIGHVHKREKAAFGEDVQQRVPLFGQQIRAGWVVAAGVQHEHGVFRLPVCKRAQIGEIDAEGFGVVIRIAADFEACGGENAAVVVPCGVADKCFGVRKRAVQQIRAQPQRARTAQGLHNGHAVFGNGAVFAEKQLGQLRAQSCVPFHRQIAFHAQTRACFGDADAFRLRHASFAVEINADAEVGFVRSRVVLEGVYQAEDGVAFIAGKVGKHGCSCGFV